jgi:DNA-binding ferritin-like protein
MSLNIIIDADVQSATQKIGKFVYTMKQDFKEVEKTVRRTSTTVKESTDKMAEAANSFGKSSRNSLTALSLTLQDLPFGFIGIQNNLPGIIQGFGQMSAEAKTGASVMTQLKTAIMGPAGLFLAFSAVTAIVTTLSMKYGGLGNAIDALFGKVNPLAKVIKDAAKSQEDLNESYKTSGQIIASATGSVESQIVKVQLLSDTVKNLSNSEELRKNALSELQKIDKAYFGQITTGTSDIVKLEEATRKYTDALLANAIAKAYEQKVTQGAINLEEQRNYLKDLAPAYAEATKRQKEFLKTFEDAYDPVTGAKIAQPGFIAVDPAIVAFDKQKLVVDAAITAQDKLKQSFSDATIEALKFVEPLEQGSKAAKDYKYQIDELIGALSFKTQIEDVKELADVILDVNKKYTSRATALKELQQLGDGVFNGLTLEKKGYDSLKDAIDTYILKLQVLDLENKGRIKAADLQAQADKNKEAADAKRKKSDEDLLASLMKQSEAYDKFGNSTDRFAKKYDKILPMLENLQKGAKNVAILMQETFFAPLNEMFTTLFTKFTFSIKSFTNAILASIGQIAAKLATTLVIQGLVSLFSAPLALGGALSPEGGLSFIGKALSGLKLGKSADFSGVQGANMGMSGSVNLVLRGTDLVGSINRTNSQISRVG